MDDQINDIVLRAQYAAKDPEVELHGSPVPVLTTLLYRYCDNDGDKFARLCDLIRIIQEETLRLNDQ